MIKHMASFFRPNTHTVCVQMFTSTKIEMTLLAAAVAAAAAVAVDELYICMRAFASESHFF